MNLLPGLAGQGQVTLDAGPILSIETQVTGEVLFGIRPEHLNLVLADAPGAITGQATLVESTGTAMFVAVQAGAMALHALFTDRPTLKRGDQIALRPKPGLSHLFDAKTEARIA